MRFSILITSLFIALSGCAVRYADNQGNQTIVGCMLMKQMVVGEPVITQVKTLGVSIDLGSRNSGVSVGYKNIIEVVPVKMNAVYELDFDSGEPFGAVLKEMEMNDSKGRH